MKFVQTYTYSVPVKRTFDKSHSFSNIYVDEFKTFYSVCIFIVGYDCPALADFRISKKIAKSPYDAYIYALEYSIKHKLI